MTCPVCVVVKGSAAFCSVFVRVCKSEQNIVPRSIAFLIFLLLLKFCSLIYSIPKAQPFSRTSKCWISTQYFISIWYLGDDMILINFVLDDMLLPWENIHTWNMAIVCLKKIRISPSSKIEQTWDSKSWQMRAESSTSIYELLWFFI